MFKSMVKDMKKNHKAIIKQYEEAPSGDAPVGRHITKIVKFGEMTASTGVEMLIVSRVIVSEEGKGEMCFENMFPGHPKMGHRFIQWLEKIGYELEDPNDLEEILDSVIADEVNEEVQITENDEGYKEVKFRRVIEDFEPGEEDPDPENGTDEGNPDEAETVAAVILLVDSHYDDLGLDEKMDLEELLEALKEAEVEFTTDELTEEGVELFETAELTELITDHVPGEDPGEDDPNELVPTLIALGTTFLADLGDTVDEDSALEDVVEALAEAKFPEDQLDDEDRTLLEAVGLDANIVKPAAKKKAVKKAAKKAVKKAVKKSAKKSVKKSAKKAVKKKKR